MTAKPTRAEPNPAFVLLASVAAIIAAPLLTWWLVGDLSEATVDPDYVVRPPDIAPGVERLVGVFSLLIAAASTAALYFTGAFSGKRRTWCTALGMVLAAGCLAAIGGRVFTAGVGGANIGAGLFAMVGGPIIFALLAGALLIAALKARK